MKFKAIIDTREDPKYFYNLEYAPGKILDHEVAGLYTGDYSIKGLEHLVAVERKSLDDILGCIGSNRERFEREMQRILGYPHRLLIIESTWKTIEDGAYRSRVKTQSAKGSLLGWMSKGIPVHFAGSHAEAGRTVAQFLYVTANRRYKELKALES